ncbi:hypothetical protein HMPREF1986_00144 [Oribacterium sp. oral taxon 078 str. F0263]|nr:hypothetical protein HMPREF1986_00144 [Oribacterium sp. oral taxon 078 str. F0263]
MVMLRIGGHSFLAEHFLHAEADAWPIAAAFAGVVLLWRHRQVIAVFFTEYTAGLAILPKVTLAAGCRALPVVANALDHNCAVHLKSSTSLFDTFRQ